MTSKTEHQSGTGYETLPEGRNLLGVRTGSQLIHTSALLWSDIKAHRECREGHYLQRATAREELQDGEILILQKGVPMLRQLILSIILSAALITATVAPVLADCRDEIREVRNDIDKNKELYTKEAIVKARKHLVRAEVPSLRPAECRRQVLAAKKALRKGKK